MIVQKNGKRINEKGVKTFKLTLNTPSTPVMYSAIPLMRWWLS